jgi:hypothetical protein
MGFQNDKLTATNSISQFDIMSTLPKIRITSSIESVNSHLKNLLPFLLDMLNQIMKDKTPKVPSFNTSFNAGGGVPSSGGGGGSIPGFPNISPGNAGSATSGAGGSKIKQILIEILLEFLPSLALIIKEGIIKAIKSSYSCNSSTKIPTATLPSVTIDISKIDLSNTLKIDPDSIGGPLTYGTDSSTDLNLFIRELLQTEPGTPSATKSWGGLLDLTFNGTTITITMGSGYSGKLFDTFLSDFMDSISVIGVGSGDVSDKVSFLMTQVMENLFGTISSNMDISVDTLVSLEETNMMMEKVFNSDPCVDNFVVEDNFFNFSNEDLKTINDKAKARYQGYNTVDMGCGVAKSSISIDDLTQITDTIKNSKPTEVKNVVEQSIETMSEIIASDVSPENKENVKAGFTTKFINEIPKVFTGVIFSPKILVMYHIVHKLFRNEELSVSDAEGNVSSSSFVFDNKVFFNFVARESLAALLEILYDILKREVLKLVSKLGIKLVKEQAELKLKSILSIIYSYTDGTLVIPPIPSSNS